MSSLVPNVQARESVALEQDLGRGFYGVVYRAQWGPRAVAVKALTSAADATQKQMFLREAQQLHRLRHAHIVAAVGLVRHPEPLLVLELLPLGALDDYVRSHQSELDTAVLLHFALQTARALAFLEQHSMVHRDVAARNVLVADAHTVKLSDFGLARPAGYVHNTRSMLPVRWYPPEALSPGHIYSSKHDIWSWAGMANRRHARLLEGEKDDRA